MTNPRLLFLCSGRRVPSTRYRILPYVRRLRADGFRCDVAFSFPEKYDSFRILGWTLSQKLKRTVRRWHCRLAEIRDYSAIVIEREIFDDPTFDLEERLSRLDARLILDIDDGVFLRYPEKFQKLLPLFDHVIAGSQIIAKAIGDQCRSISVIPTVVEIKEYQVREDFGAHKQPVLGWIGTDSNVEYLTMVAPVIRRLQKEQNLSFRVITGKESSIESLRKTCHVEFVKWSAESATDELAKFTIGIMPLPDDQWQRYKCGCKLIEYFACGLPAIASPVGTNCEIVLPKTNGFLATTEKEWESSLRELLESPSLRQSMGNAGRQLVESTYSVHSQYASFVEAISFR